MAASATQPPPGAPLRSLVHGASMPALGLGTWAMDDRDAAEVIARAIEAGYRLIDTAAHYDNEAGVGAGMCASGIPREHVFVTTKLTARFHSVDGVRRAFRDSSARLSVDYLDLFLIHWPNPGQDRYVDAWRGMVRLLEDGDVRAIGVSNFKPAHLDRIIAETGVVPDVNQIQVSPRLTRRELLAHHAEHGIVTQSWTPLAKGGDLLAEPAITDVANRHRRTAAQVVLRWHVELGLIPLPKSSNPGRMRENLDVFDFALAPDEVDAISSLDRGALPTWDSDVYGL